MQRAHVRNSNSGFVQNRNTGRGGGGGAYLPAGAVPSQNGVLSAHAKEFWFPECRNCTCCKGFKHGCDCCVGGVDTCKDAECVSSEHTTQVASQLASRPAATDHKISHTAPAAAGPPPRSSGGSFLPPGAVPSQNGVLSAHAKEFWFPECRNCTCCKGFKHGCDCCVGGVDTCKNAECVSAEHTTQVASELASRPAGDAGSAPAPAPAVAPAPASMPAPAPAPSPRYSAAPPRPPASDEVCKFFMSGGCRFGDSCRNAHPGVPTSPNAGGQRICQFFLAGNCTYGDSCRNAHTRPPAAGL
jgi:hypothetical protein